MWRTFQSLVEAASVLLPLIALYQLGRIAFSGEPEKDAAAFLQKMLRFIFAGWLVGIFGLLGGADIDVACYGPLLCFLWTVLALLLSVSKVHRAIFQDVARLSSYLAPIFLLMVYWCSSLLVMDRATTVSSQLLTISLLLSAQFALIASLSDRRRKVGLMSLALLGVWLCLGLVFALLVSGAD